MNKKKVARRLAYISIKLGTCVSFIVSAPIAYIAGGIDAEAAHDGIEIFRQENNLHKKHGL